MLPRFPSLPLHAFQLLCITFLPWILHLRSFDQLLMHLAPRLNRRPIGNGVTNHTRLKLDLSLNRFPIFNLMIDIKYREGLRNSDEEGIISDIPPRTNSTSIPKNKIPWVRFRLMCRRFDEAVRIEFHWLEVDRRIVRKPPRIRHQHTALGNPKPVVDILGSTGMWEPHRSDGMPAVRFFHYGHDVGEGITVRGDGKTTGTNYAVEFFLSFLLHFGEHGHC